MRKRIGGVGVLAFGLQRVTGWSRSALAAGDPLCSRSSGRGSERSHPSMGPFGLSAGVARWVARVRVWLSLAAAIVLRFADPEPLPTFRNAFFDFAQRLLPPADDTPQAPHTIVQQIGKDSCTEKVGHSFEI